MIYLIHGADSFRAREKLNELIAEFGVKDNSRMNLEIFDAENTDANKIKAASQSLGFFSPARMIVVKNLFSEGDIKTKEEIADYAVETDKKKRDADFVFFERLEIGKKGAAGGKEWSVLAKAGNVFNFSLMNAAEINKWIVSRISACGGPDRFDNNLKEGRKIKITREAANKLAFFVGGDLWRLNAEIEKLVLLKMDFSEKGKKEGNMEINEQDVEDLVKSDLPSNIFSTIDALAKRDKKTALKLLAGHLEKGEAPIYLFTMFVYQFRNLLKVKDAMMRKKTASQGEIAEETKLHPFVVSKTIAQANGFSYEYLKKVYKRFFKFDFLIKKGRLNAEAALELLIIEIGNLS